MLIRPTTLRHRSSEPSLTLLLAPYAPPSVHSLPMRAEWRPRPPQARCSDALSPAPPSSAPDAVA